MKNYLSLSLLFLSFCIYGQYGSVKINYSGDPDEITSDITIYKLGMDTPLITTTYYCDVDPVEEDSLLPGIYILKAVGRGPKQLIFSRKFEIKPSSITSIDIEFNATEEYIAIDTSNHSGIYTNKSDAEINLAFVDNRWLDPKGVFTNGFMIGYGGHGWNAYSKHIGILYGGGMAFHYNEINTDTSFIDGGSYKKIRESYAYLDAHLDFKLRFSGGNQQAWHEVSPKLLLELGAVYNFPLYFRYSGRYEGNKKNSAQGIHQFTDIRVFVNAGYYPFVFFYEYRLGDFVIGKYPELPRSTFGLRIFFDTE